MSRLVDGKRYVYNYDQTSLNSAHSLGILEGARVCDMKMRAQFSIFIGMHIACATIRRTMES